MKTPFLDFLTEQHKGSNFDGLSLTQSSYRILIEELKKSSPNSHFSHVLLNGINVYLVWGGQHDSFYKKRGNERKHLYPMEEINKPISTVTPEHAGVAINMPLRGFTNGQLLLLHRLNQRLKEKTAFSIDDAREVYVRTMYRGPQQVSTVFNHYLQAWEHKNYNNGLAVIQEHPDYYDYSMKIWLKSNLGALMMKGALIGIPVIQLGDNMVKGLDK